MKSLRLIAAVVTLIILALFTACSAGKSVSTTDNTPQDDKASVVPRPQTLPDFTFYTMDGAAFSNKNLDPNKDALFLYLDPDCIFCQTAVQRFESNIEQFKSVQIFIVSVHSIKELRNFISVHDLESFPEIKMLRDKDQTFEQLFYVQYYPALYLYNSEGKYMRDFQGLANMSEVEAELKKN